MKTVLGAVLLASQALAFPSSAVFDAVARAPDQFTRSLGEAKAQHEKRQLGQNVGFNAKAQYVSNKGKYKFVAPGPSDLRGPCPGLNAMANHGYMPHNGVATIQQFIDGTYDTFGMGKDLGGFLAVYGAIFDGDLVSWSIGGPQPMNLVSSGAGLLGQPLGISGSHNKYEADVSPTRGDLYQAGNDYEVILDRFKDLYSYQADETEETSNYDLGVLTSYRVKLFKQSIDTNPYFFNNFFSGFQVQPAAFTFIYRFMSNKSEEYPEGRLSQDVLKAFFGITGDTPDTFAHIPGHERIPDNWYKRAIGDEYTIPFFEVDLLAAAAQFPQFLSIGGNTGKVNTFTGLDPTNITGGLYNLQTLGEGHNGLCFTYQLIGQQSPDILGGTLTNVGDALKPLNKILGSLIAEFGCPELSSKQLGQFAAQFKQFPGYSKLNPKTGKYDL